MHNALARITQTEQCYVAFCRIGFELADHRRNLGIDDAFVAAARRDIVIGDAEGQGRLGDGAPAFLHLAESMERALMHVMAVNQKQSGPVVAPHNLVR